MSASYSGKRIRMAFDVTKDTPTMDSLSGMPHVWRGTTVRFEIAGFFGDPQLAETEILDVSNISSITLDVMPISRNGTLIMTKTMSAAGITLDLTREQWLAGTDQQMVFEFSNTETAPALTSGALFTDYYLVVTVTTNDSPAHKITWGIATLRIEEDGHGNQTTPAIGDPTYYTAPQTDARILALFAQYLNPVAVALDGGTGLYYPLQVVGTGDTRRVVVGDTSTALADGMTTLVLDDGTGLYYPLRVVGAGTARRLVVGDTGITL